MAGDELTLSSAATGAAGGAHTNEELISGILSSATGGNPNGPSLTQFGPQPITPRPPLQYKSPEGAFAIPQGSYTSTGERQRAEKQALFGGIAKMVKSGTDFIQAKKTRVLQMDIERLMSAMDGLKEASASGDKEAMAHNAQIINDITTDPKKAKQISKAFNIDLLGGGKNKTENQALYGAYKEYDKKFKSGETSLNPNAQKLMAGMPQRQQVNPELAIRAQMIKDNLIPGAKEMLEQQTKIQEEVSKNMRAAATAANYADRTKNLKEAADNLAKLGQRKVDEWAKAEAARTKQIGDVAVVHANASVQIEREKVVGQLKLGNEKMQNLLDLANINNQAKKDISSDKNKTQKEIAADNLKNKQQSTIIKSLTDQQKNLLGRIQVNDKEMGDIEKTTKDPKFLTLIVDPGQRAAYQSRWNAAKQENTKLKQDQETLNKTIQQMQQLQFIPTADNSVTGAPGSPVDTGSIPPVSKQPDTGSMDWSGANEQPATEP